MLPQRQPSAIKVRIKPLRLRCRITITTTLPRRVIGLVAAFGISKPNLLARLKGCKSEMRPRGRMCLIFMAAHSSRICSLSTVTESANEERTGETCIRVGPDYEQVIETQRDCPDSVCCQLEFVRSPSGRRSLDRLLPADAGCPDYDVLVDGTGGRASALSKCVSSTSGSGPNLLLPEFSVVVSSDWRSAAVLKSSRCCRFVSK